VRVCVSSLDRHIGSLYYAHDDAKDQEKPFTVELSWCGAATGNKFKSVPKELYEAATAGVSCVRVSCTICVSGVSL
jgi:hypothetical protein